MASNKASGNQADLPDDFFDASKKSKKEQEEAAKKELELLEKEKLEAEAAVEDNLRRQFYKLQKEKDVGELAEQMNQFQRLAEIERIAKRKKEQTLANKHVKMHENDAETKNVLPIDEASLSDSDDIDEALFDWRSKGVM